MSKYWLVDALSPSPSSNMLVIVKLVLIMIAVLTEPITQETAADNAQAP